MGRGKRDHSGDTWVTLRRSSDVLARYPHRQGLPTVAGAGTASVDLWFGFEEARQAAGRSARTAKDPMECFTVAYHDERMPVLRRGSRPPMLIYDTEGRQRPLAPRAISARRSAPPPVQSGWPRARRGRGGRPAPAKIFISNMDVAWNWGGGSAPSIALFDAIHDGPGQLPAAGRTTERNQKHIYACKDLLRLRRSSTRRPHPEAWNQVRRRGAEAGTPKVARRRGTSASKEGDPPPTASPRTGQGKR